MKRKTAWRLLLTVVLGLASVLPASGAVDSNLQWTEGVITEVVPLSAEQPSLMLGVEDYFGGRALYPVDVWAVITIDRLPARFAALRPGMEVYIGRSGGVITTVEAFSTAVSGYIEPESRMAQGRVTAISRNEITVLSGTGRLSSYYVTPTTLVSRQGQVAPLDSIYVGDKVKLFFNQYASPEVSRIEVEGESVIISGVSKGTLQSVNRVSSRMVVGDVSALGSGAWENPSPPTVTLDWRSDMPLYAGAAKIPYTQLSYYQGRTVYWATSRVLGRDRIARMVVQSGYETTYEGQIEDIGVAHDALRLNNNKNLALHEGAIVIRDGRLQDVNSLQPGMDVYIIADGTLPGVVAEVVYVLNAGAAASDLGQYRIYAGPMEVLLDQSIRLSRFFMLEDHEWVNYAEDKELYYDNETKLFDADMNRAVAVADFIRGDYYADHYVYAYTVGDRCVGIWVDKRLRLPRTISSATVSAKRSTLPNDRDITLSFSEERLWLGEAWTFTYPTDKHFLENAMIVKNDAVVSVDAVTPGDRLYMICNDNVPRIAIIK
jgi:hypothetical protein